eukprot:c43965_g1_i1 orf=2-190(-)
MVMMKRMTLKALCPTWLFVVCAIQSSFCCVVGHPLMSWPQIFKHITPAGFLEFVEKSHMCLPP